MLVSEVCTRVSTVFNDSVQVVCKLLQSVAHVHVRTVALAHFRASTSGELAHLELKHACRSALCANFDVLMHLQCTLRTT
jgi:hypothetical protein